MPEFSGMFSIFNNQIFHLVSTIMGNDNGVKNKHDKEISGGIMLDWSVGYKHRNMLQVSVSSETDGPQLSIMTYNIMSCCGKKRFKTSDGTPYFNFRYDFLTHEIARYDSDILCLQEVECKELPLFKLRLNELGYEMVLLKHNIVNTMAICYRKNLFDSVLFEVCNYSVKMELSSFSSNCAMMLCLTFKDEFLNSFSTPLKEGLIIVNTHLRQGACWKILRAQQTAGLLNFIRKFSEKCLPLVGPSGCYTFLAGDLNSTAADPAYLSLVSKPFQYDHELAQFITDSHNNIDLRAMSLYSVGYKSFNNTNSDSVNHRNEPEFSFWGPNWHGLCDYIFMVCDWAGDEKTEVDTLEEFTEATSVKLLALLRIPRHEEMDGALPKVGYYPSDHLCMMADVELV